MQVNVLTHSLTQDLGDKKAIVNPQASSKAAIMDLKWARRRVDRNNGPILHHSLRPFREYGINFQEGFYG
jgi:hypothetical protein